MKYKLFAITLLLALSVSPLWAESGGNAQNKSAQTSHQGSGKVVSIEKAKLTVRLAHDAIKSLGWPGMTMDFKVANAAVLEGIKAGDAVTFELGMDANTGKWLVNRITPQGTKQPVAY